MLNIISLGAGVQSSVMALMAAKGHLKPMPTCAIFSDTQWEGKKVMAHLDWLEKQLPFPVYRVTYDNIRKRHMETAGIRTAEELSGNSNGQIPFFMEGAGMLMRQCTGTYKLAPLRKKIREIVGLKYRERSKGVLVHSWIGISVDEASRMKDAPEPYIQARWPLIEINFSREDCKFWFAKHYPGRVLTKSACIGCPYRPDKDWREMKMSDPDSFADAVEFDHALRVAGDGTYQRLGRRAFLHKSCLSLDEVDFRNLEDMGQLNMFEEDCEGMCGV